MKAEIISIGTELLLGQITNTNAQYISEQLAILGIPVYYHTAVGDNPERIKHQLQISSNRSDVLIFTGGLGPTKDDLTKETIATFLGSKLTLDEKAMTFIREFFAHRKMVMTPNNERQALVIEGSTIFPNNHGLAPGMAFEQNGKHYLLFPGPPRELKPMFQDFAIPYFLNLLPDKKIVHSKVLRFCGIGESTLETELQDLIDQQTNPTIAPLAKEGEVTIRLTSLAKSIEEAESVINPVVDEIKKRVGSYLYGYDFDSLQSVVIRTLQQKKLTIATAESCTGGLIGHLLSQVSGASSVYQGGTICYTNEWKEKVGVDPATLEEFGAISKEVALELAQNVKTTSGADIGLSITGVAGPLEVEGKGVGLIFIGYSLPNRTFYQELKLSGGREYIQQRAAKLALYYLITELKKGE